MLSIDNYKELFFNTKIKIKKLYVMITIFIILFIIILTNSIYYEEIYQNTGIGTKEGYIKTVINKDDLKKIDKSNIIIDGKDYKTTVIKYNEITLLGDSFYQEIYLKVDKKIELNKYISFKVVVEKQKFYELILKKIRGNN